MNTKLALSLSALIAVGALACSSDDDETPTPTNNNNGTNNNSASPADAGFAPLFDTLPKIEAFLDGKTLTMEGMNIPSHPNGFDENFNFGQATQCYNSTVISITGTQWSTTSILGTLNNAPNVNDMGMCDNDTAFGTPLTFVSTGLAITNLVGDGECFDVSVTYTGFAQEGRGMIVDNGAEVHLELFFRDQAVGITCADGAVGSGGITLNQNPFTGDAVQKYVVSE